MSRTTAVLLAAAAVVSACTEPAGPPAAISARELARQDPSTMPAAVFVPGAAAVPAAPGGAARTAHSPPARPRTPLRVRIAPLPEALVGDWLERAFEHAHPEWDLVPLRSSDRGGLDEIDAGRADAAVVAMAPSRHDLNAGLLSLRLGFHVAVVAVADDNPVRSLTETQVRQALTGRADRWQQVAYHRGPVELWAGPPEVAHLVAAALLLPGAKLAGGVRRADSDALLAQRGRAGAQTLTLTYLQHTRNTAGLRPIAIQGVAPEFSAAAAGTYPYAREVHLAYPRAPTAAARDLIAFCQSAEGARVFAQSLTTR